MVVIHADKGRENDVIAALDLHSPYETVVKQMKVADFAISHDEKIVAAFERKTWKDLADTIKNPERRANNEKLVELQESTGCKIFYIIEGRRPINDCRGVPTTKLQSYLDARIFQNGFHISYTATPADTAQLIIRFTGYIIDHIDNLVGGYEEQVGNSAKLYQIQSKSPQVIYDAMWYKLSGITAANFPSIDISLLELFTGKDMSSYISTLKYSSGRCFGDKLTNRILSNISNVDSHIAMLTAVPRITTEKAVVILQHYSILDILQMNFDISELSHKKKLGKKLNDSLREVIKCDMARYKKIHDES